MSFESSLPTVFLVLASAAAAALIVAAWQSLRAALGVTAARDRDGFGAGLDQGSLLDEKAALLRSIKDLEFERAVGKISDADFEKMNAAFRARAKVILALLDADLEPYRAQAEALLAGAGTQPDASSTRITSDSMCSKCDSKNDSDAQFCKKCGARIESPSSSPPPSSEVRA